jgi:hypothetical protein
MAQDVKALESSMRQLQQSCAALGRSQYFDEFFQIIHRPGWTTVLDELFVGAMIAGIQDQVQGATKHLERLMAGARQVGR